jgi:phospholipid/cholesterol/gamma-HCH transport system substrate-binding protein
MKNAVFYTLVSLALISLFGMWFFWHPNSPWHSRNYYYVSFDEIGSLKVNNAVNVNGLLKGRVVDFNLTDSCVWAKVSVLSDVKIPKDSKFNIANAGLMGERVIEISLGKSKAYYEDGARIKGFFDIGSTNIGSIMVDIVKEANSIVDILTETGDSLFSDEKTKTYDKMGQKIDKLGRNISRVVSSSERSLKISLDSLTIAKNKAADILDNIGPNLDNVAENAESLKKNITSLEKSLIDIKSNITSIAQKLKSGENSISLSLDEEHQGKLRQEMQKVVEDAEKLMESIKKRGLDLNVDIF